MNDIECLRKAIITELIRLQPEEGVHQTALQNLVFFRYSHTHAKSPQLYQPGAGILVQGRKRLTVEGKTYEQHPEQFHCLVTPMPVTFETIEASPDRPLLGIGIFFDRLKLSKLLMRIENSKGGQQHKTIETSSVILTAHPTAKLLETLLRLIKMLSRPLEIEILGEQLEQELYFHILTQPGNGQLLDLLASNGKVRQIAGAVEYINQNLNKNCTIDELAKTVNMSSSGFQKKFKEVMHISPGQYAKQVKLNLAKGLLRSGTTVSQALWQVGYNNAGQFSREYKRQFGVPPSMDYVDL